MSKRQFAVTMTSVVDVDENLLLGSALVDAAAKGRKAMISQNQAMVRRVTVDSFGFHSRGDGATVHMAPAECNGKAAARALAVMVLDPKIRGWLQENDPKAFNQACEALTPFGWPDLDALAVKVGKP